MLLYGSGVRLEECLELRVKDLDFDRHQIIVRQGKGQKDRVTMLPAAITETLTRHLADVRRLHEADLARGFGRVVLPSSWIASFPMRRPSGDGSSCFRPDGSAAIHANGSPSRYRGSTGRTNVNMRTYSSRPTSMGTTWRFVTAYRPNGDEWESDLKSRKGQK